MLLSLLYTFSFFAFNTKAMMPNDARLESTAALVKGADADFVFLTEEYTGQLKTMLEDCYPYAATARSHIDETERFYSKYPIVGVEDIGAMPTERGKDVWVHKVLVVKEAGDTLNIYCCHLPHDTGQRSSIVKALIDDMGAGPRRAILGGDMNSLSFSRPIITLGGAGLKDAWLEKGSGSGATFHGSIIGVRIDYIFHSGDLAVQSVRRISASGISDHDALTARFSILPLK